MSAPTVPAAVYHDAIRALRTLQHHMHLLHPTGLGAQLAMQQAAKVLADHDLTEPDARRTEPEAEPQRVIPQHLRAPVDDYHRSDSYAQP